jgi:hypothetical protein
MKRLTILIASISLVLLLAPTQVSSQDSEISREGNWRIWYTSPDLRAELDFHWADRHLEDEWLILKFSVAGGSKGVTSVNQKDVRLRGPDGTIFGLPTQAEYRAVRGSMRVAFKQQNVWSPPASRFVGSLVRIEDWFFNPSGTVDYRETIHPSSAQYCSGPLMFQIPGGVQPGGWTLLIGPNEIPFVLGENE